MRGVSASPKLRPFNIKSIKMFYFLQKLHRGDWKHLFGIQLKSGQHYSDHTANYGVDASAHFHCNLPQTVA